MSLTLVTGRAHAGKTGEVHAALRRVLSSGQRAVLLLPTTPDVERAEHEFHAEPSGMLTITTLDMWAADLWALFGDGRRLVDDVARRTLLRRAVEESPGAQALPALGTDGFIELLADIARGLAPADSRDTRAGSDPVVAATTEALDRYCHLLAIHDLIEPIAAIPAMGSSLPTVADIVVVNRFTELTRVQESLLIALSQASEVVVTLPWSPDFPATQYLDEQATRLRAVGDVRHIAAPTETTELGLLGERLFASEPVLLSPTGQVVLAEATGAEAEIALVARMVAEEIGKGRAADRIAVVFRDAAARAEALEAAFEAEEIPLALDVVRPFSATEYGKAMLRLLQQAAKDAPDRRVLSAFLTGPYCPANPSDADSLDARWRRARAQGPELARGVRDLGPGVRRMWDLASAVMRAGGIAGREDEWQELAGLLLASAVDKRGAHEGWLRRDAAAHRGLCAVVSQLSRVAGIQTRPADLLRELSNARVHEARGDQAGVLVTEAHRLRSRRFDMVVLGGLTAHEFSSARPASLRQQLGETMGEPMTGESRLKERMLFYLVATRAKDKLVLLRQSADADGQELRASAFWDEVVALYVGHDECAGPPCIRLTTADLASATSQCDAVGARLAGPPHSGVRFESEEILESLRAIEEFAVTELETYTQCPRRWFHDRVVRPRELDRTFDVREVGGLAHAILAAFYAVLPERLGVKRVTPATLATALELLDDVVGEVAGPTRQHGLREELSLDRVRRLVARAVTQDARLMPGLDPIAHEMSFGDEAGMPVDLGDMRVRGRIDRLDASDTGIVVTDYKTGSVRGWSSFGDAGVIQAPLYAHVAGLLYGRDVLGGVYRSLASGRIRGFWKPGAVDLGGLGSDTDALADEDMRVLIDEAISRARAAARGIRGGRIEPTPGAAACTYCGLSKTREVSSA